MSTLLGLEEKDTNAVDRAATVNREELEAKMKSGGSWFYWIAGLSAINSAIYLFGGEVAFLAGLGFTLMADALVDAAIDSGLPSGVKAVAIIFNFILVAMFALFGYYANKRFAVAFIVGIVIYVLDALLLLLLGSFFSAAFHAFALFFIIRGFLACRKLNASQESVPFQTPPPPASA